MRNGRHIRIPLIIAILAVAAVALGAYAWHVHLVNTPTATRGATGKGGAETATGIKQPPSSAPSTQPSPTPTAAAGTTATPASVKPVISTLPYVSGGQVHLRAYANGASGATCTLTLAKSGSSPVTATAAANAQGVCQGFDIDDSSMAAGSWSATVSVSSPNVEGTSDAAAFTIQ